MSVPSGWSVSQFGSDTIAFGDSDDAMQSRLYAVKPDLATDTPLTGSGGVVVLYPMAQFGIDPQNPDLSGLMQRVAGSLQGYTVVQAAQPLAGSDGAFYAEITNGAETGYVALIPVGDQIAYVTATTTPDNFDALQGDLLNILMSVHKPTPTELGLPPSGPSGLGGLGGLEQTPEPTPGPSGLGGLGGLGGDATEAPGG